MTNTPASHFTLMFVKPDAIHPTKVDKILDLSLDMGFFVAARKESLQLTREFIERFYAEHVGKPFFDEHAGFLGEGYCNAYLLHSKNPSNLPVPEHYRLLVGNTDPTKASKGTLRKLFGSKLPRNAVHASDSVAAVKREALFFFSGLELVRAGAGSLLVQEE